MKSSSLHSAVRFRRASFVAGFLALITFGHAQTTYTLTAPVTGNANWSAGTWTGGIPVSSSTTTLTFSQAMTGTSILTNDLNSGSPFNLTTLNDTHSGNFGLTLAGTQLNFNGTSNLINFGSAIADTISAPINFTNGLTVSVGAFVGYTISGVITGSGGLIKNGTNGSLTLSNANTYTGGTILNANILTVGNNGALGSGTLHINAGTLSAPGRTLTNAVEIAGDIGLIDGNNNGNIILSGTVDLLGGTRTITTFGTVALGSTATLSGNISNGGIIKSGVATLKLSGTANSYTGGTTISNGVLQFNTDGAIPSSGNILLKNGGALEVNGSSLTALDTVAGWLSSGKIDATSAGIIALKGTSALAVDFSANGGYNLFLGAAATSTFSGTLTPNGTTYRLGGGGFTLTLSGANVLTGANTLLVGPALTIGSVGSTAIGTQTTSGGTVAFSNSNSLTGATTVNSGILSFTGATGSLATSDVTLRPGAALNFAPTTASSVTRVKSATLNGAALSVTGPAFATTDTITNALTLNSGVNTITVTPVASGSNTLAAGSLARTTGTGWALVNGVNLGMDSSTVSNVGRITFGTTPALVGTTAASATGINSGAQNTQIVPWLVGAVTATTGGTGTATGAANTFLTYNSATGLRPLNLTDEFTSNAITTGNNTYITAATTGASTASINSMVVQAANATPPVLSLNSGVTLTVASGALLFTPTTTNSANTATIQATSGTATLDFGSAEGIITIQNPVTSSTTTATITTDITGSGGLSKFGAGTLALTGAKSYTGATTLNAGTVSIDTLANGGSNSSVGASSSSAANLLLNGGILTYTGAATSTDRLISVGLSGGAILSSGTGGINFTNTGAIGFNGESGARILNLGGSGAFTNTFAALIGDNGGPTTVLKSIINSTWVLTNVNTYTGSTQIIGDANNGAGTLSISSIANGGVASNIGASSNAASNLIINRGILQYTGAAASTDRLFTIGSNSGATIDASGTGALNFTNTGALAFSSPGPRTLTLTGTNTGNNTFAPVIGNSVDGSGQQNTSLAKTGAGTWVLTGINTYSGTTTISVGTLALSGSGTFGTGTLTVSGGTADLGTKSITNTLGSLTAGGVVTNGTVTNNGGNYDLQNGSVAAVLAGSNGLNKTSASTVTLSGVNTYTGTTTVSAGTLTVTNASALGTTAGGTSITGTGTLDVQTNIGTESISLSGTGGLVNSTGSGTVGGTVSLTGSAIVGGAGTLALNGIIDGTGFGITKTGAGTTTLSAANTYSGGTTISAGTLALSGSGTFGTGTLTVSAGTADLGTKSITNTLGSLTGGAVTNGTITNNSGIYDVQNGSVSASLAGSNALTKSTTNTVTLTGANTYTGATTVNQGTLQLTLAASGASKDNIINNTANSSGLALGGGTLIIQGAASTVNSQRFNGVTVNPGASQLTSTIGTTGTVNSTLGTVTRNTGGTMNITLPATGTVGISNSNDANGLLGAGIIVGGNDWATVSGGNVAASTYTTQNAVGSWTANQNITNSAALTGSLAANLTINSLRFNNNVTTAAALGSSTLTVLDGILVTSTVSGKTETISGGSIQGSAGGDLIVINNGASSAVVTISSNVVDNTSATAFTKSGAGKVTLSGATNTYTGATYVNAGTLAVGVATTAFGSNSAVVVSTGATLDITGFSQTIGSLASNTSTGTGTVTLGAATLTTGGNNTNTTFGGVIGGTGVLTKTGTGTQTLTGANTYTGATNVNNGILNAQNATALGTTAGGVIVASGATLQVQGGISIGAEALTVSGTGYTGQNGALVNVSGINTYAGLLTLGADTTVSSDSGTFNLTAATTITGAGFNLTLTGAGDGVLTSILGTVAGSLTKNGAGTWTLKGANTFTGTTTISTGSLQLGSGSTTGSLATTGAIVNNGTFIINRSNAVAQGTDFSSAAITGTGSFTQAGSGTTTMNAANTYSGNTTISAGTLALGLGASFANSPVITVGSTGSTGTVLDLTANSSFGFGVGQTVKGIGTINLGSGKTVTFASGSALTPGNSIGTLAVTGNLTLASGSASTFELGTAGTRGSPGTSDRTTVTGALTLGGTLTLADNAGANSNGSAGAGSYQIFTQTGLAGGSFGSVTNNVAGTRAAVDASTSGSVYVDVYNKAAAAGSQTVNIATRIISGANTAATAGVSLTNTGNATAPYQETLGTTVFSGTTSGFTATGSATGIAGGSSGGGSLSVGVGAGTFATSGVHSGSTTLGLQTEAVNSSGLGTLGIGSQTVNINVTAYDLASPTVSKASGDGTLGGAGTSYTLDFGTGLTVGQTYTANLRLNNADLGSGYQDGIKAGYTYTMTNGATITVNSISQLALAAGQYSDFSISFLGASAGSYGDTLTLGALFSQQSGLSDYGLSNIDITITAAAIPEPSTYAAIFGALALAGAALRRRRKQG